MEELVIVKPARLDGDAWEVDVRVFSDESKTVKTIKIARGSFIYLMPYMGNFQPPFRYRLTVQGETAEGSEEEMQALLRWVEAEMAEQWRRELEKEAYAPKVRA